MATAEEWALLDQLEAHMEAMEERIRTRIASLGWVRLLKTLAGIRTILGSTIYLEIGEVSRFASAPHLANYAGLVPRCMPVAGNPGQDRRHARPIILKWAFVEAANVITARRRRGRISTSSSYLNGCGRISAMAKQLRAVARHLAESSWWILSKKQPY
jgi:transposase